MTRLRHVGAFGKIPFLGCHRWWIHPETGTDLLTFPNHLMRISTFIGVTSLLICGWLGAAFFRDVPTGNYPAIQSALSGNPEAGDKNALAASLEENARER